MKQATWELSAPAATIVITLLAIVSAYALGADLGAAYPRGDGGFFDAIIGQILTAHFAYPESILFNGAHVPFAYSPLAFYGVAVIAKLTSLSVPRVMNLWVIAWDALIAPAAYFAARRFLRRRVEALVATAFLVVYTPGALVWLGMGGATTRAPAFVFFLLAAGATVRAFRENDVKSAVGAGIFAALCAWLHMEYAYLYAGSFTILVLFYRPQLRVAALLAVVGAIATMPWLVLNRDHAAAFASALQTPRLLPYSSLLETYLGTIIPTGWIGLLGFFCMLSACVVRQYLWLAWTCVLVAIDMHWGAQAAHLPCALAIGWVFGRLEALPEMGAKRAALLLLVGLLFEIALAAARVESLGIFRLQSSDVRDFVKVASRTKPNAWIIQEFPGAVEGVSFTDQTYEWLPDISGRRSPIVAQGFEWLDSAQHRERIVRYLEFQGRCTREGSACVARFIKRILRPSDEAYVFIPNHGNAYPLISSEMRSNKTFAVVFESQTSTLFKFIW